MTWLAGLLPIEGERLRRAIFAVAVLGVLTKAVVGMLVFSHDSRAVFESSDSHEYHQLALNILRYGSFSQSANPPLEPEMIRTPAYPFLLACMYRLAGLRPNAVVVIQIALSLVTMLAGCRIATLLFGQRAGLLTGIFLALDPVSLYYSQVILTETLFAAALTLSLLGILYALRRPSFQYPCWAGMGLALATYTRPTGYYLGILLPVGLFLAVMRARGWRPALTSAVLMWLMFAVPIAGWQIRNYVSTGSAEFSQAKNQYLLIAKAAAIVAVRDGLSLQDAQQRLAEQHAATLRRDVARSSAAALLESQGRFAQAIVAAHPVLLIRTTLQGAAANLFGPSNLAHLFGSDNMALREAFLRQDFARFALREWITAIGSWTFGFLFLGVLYAGIWSLLKDKEQRNWDIALLALTAAYVILVSSGPEAYSRFRMPVMPIFCVLAAGGYLCRVERSSGEPEGVGNITAGSEDLAVVLPGGRNPLR